MVFFILLTGINLIVYLCVMYSILATDNFQIIKMEKSNIFYNISFTINFLLLTSLIVSAIVIFYQQQQIRTITEIVDQSSSSRQKRSYPHEGPIEYTVETKSDQFVPMDSPRYSAGGSDDLLYFPIYTQIQVRF